MVARVRVRECVCARERSRKLHLIYLINVKLSMMAYLAELYPFMTLFNNLGLFSRSDQCLKKHSKLRWECTS